MSKHLVFVGGGHAHMTALLNIRDTIRRGHTVTLISLSPYQYYSGMGRGCSPVCIGPRRSGFM